MPSGPVASPSPLAAAGEARTYGAALHPRPYVAEPETPGGLRTGTRRMCAQQRPGAWGARGCRPGGARPRGRDCTTHRGSGMRHPDRGLSLHTWRPPCLLSTEHRSPACACGDLFPTGMRAPRGRRMLSCACSRQPSPWCRKSGLITTVIWTGAGAFWLSPARVPSVTVVSWRACSCPSVFPHQYGCPPFLLGAQWALVRPSWFCLPRGVPGPGVQQGTSRSSSRAASVQWRERVGGCLLVGRRLCAWCRASSVGMKRSGRPRAATADDRRQLGGLPGSLGREDLSQCPVDGVARARSGGRVWKLRLAPGQGSCGGRGDRPGCPQPPC